LIQPGRYATSVSGNEVLFVNPVPEKGVDLAFQIAALCPRRRFRFVEGWPLDARRWEALQERARTLPNVTLQRSSQDMRPIYAATRVLIVPSLWQEAWGRIVTEAQLNGIPVVASRIGGLPESVGDGGVLLGMTAGAAAWAAEIERLFDDSGHHAAMSRLATTRAAAPELTADVLVQRLLLTARGVLDDR
jgi:glycosyltransferase involved in cell wall biosynthesis